VNVVERVGSRRETVSCRAERVDGRAFTFGSDRMKKVLGGAEEALGPALRADPRKGDLADFQ
jgi:hypothetical protein